MWDYIANVISLKTGVPFSIKNKSRILGGDINQTWQISNQNKIYFVKINHLDMHLMFKAEMMGLNALKVNGGTRIPKTIACGTFSQKSYLIIEYIQLSSCGGDFARFAKQLSKIHKKTQPVFGFSVDNFIGSTPQSNMQMENWADFYGQNRLLPQLRLAKKNGYTSFLDLGYQLVQSLNTFFTTYQPQPSLLHGDLWGGNMGFDEHGNPVIYDPACYFGDREADIAMTELFGRLDEGFYHAYNDIWPLDEGYRVRKHLYNLYHIINHCNLFGGGYEKQTTDMIKKLRCEIY